MDVWDRIFELSGVKGKKGSPAGGSEGSEAVGYSSEGSGRSGSQASWSRHKCMTMPKLRAVYAECCQHTFEAKQMDLKEMACNKYGPDCVWTELPLTDQVDLITEAMTSRGSLNPDSVYCKCWDVLLVTVLIYTAVVTPLDLAFVSSQPRGLVMLNHIVDIIFVKDLLLQFFLQTKTRTAKGTVWLSRRSLIAKAYLKSWFLLDFVSTVPYDTCARLLVDTTSARASSTDLEQLKALRLLRVLKILKLMRLLRSSRVAQRWENNISIRYPTRYLFRFSCLILLTCHWMACLWGLVGMIQGTNLECRNSMSSDDSRLVEHPERMYFFKGDFIDDPYSPQRWMGNSWVVKFASLRTARSSTDPCDLPTIYLASLYWSITTITSIGYGDILPMTPWEYVVCCFVMMASSILWAYIISVACAVMMTMNPEQTEFEQRMDSFNTMAEFSGLPSKLRLRGREYIREERHHERYVRHLGVMSLCGVDLRCSIASVMSSHFFDHIWFLKRAGDMLKCDLAVALQPHFLDRREIVDFHKQLCILERGAVGRCGKVMVPFAYWGEDMLLRTDFLRTRKLCTTITFCEIVTLTRESLSTILARYPHELKWFRRCASTVALARMASAYVRSDSINRTSKEFQWIKTIFNEARKIGKADKDTDDSDSDNAVDKQLASARMQASWSKLSSSGSASVGLASSASRPSKSRPASEQLESSSFDLADFGGARGTQGLPLGETSTNRMTLLEGMQAQLDRIEVAVEAFQKERARRHSKQGNGMSEDVPKLPVKMQAISGSCLALRTAFAYKVDVKASL